MTQQRDEFYNVPGKRLFINRQVTYPSSTGGASAFTALTDTPASYTGEAGSLIEVKQTEDGLEFIGLEYGAGFNVLMVRNIAGKLYARWVDIQNLIIALTGAANVQIRPSTLVIPVPTVGKTVSTTMVAAQTVTRSLTIPVPSTMESGAASNISPQVVSESLTVPVPSVTDNAST